MPEFRITVTKEKVKRSWLAEFDSKERAKESVRNEGWETVAVELMPPQTSFDETYEQRMQRERRQAHSSTIYHPADGHLADGRVSFESGADGGSGGDGGGGGDGG